MSSVDENNSFEKSALISDEYRREANKFGTTTNAHFITSMFTIIQNSVIINCPFSQQHNDWKRVHEPGIKYKIKR